MKISFSILLASLTLGLFSQVPESYFVGFTTKNGTPYSIDQPEAFLSTRAISRRMAQQIAISTEDLPVNPAFIDSIRSTGVAVLNPTKWFNGVTVYTSDPFAMEAILAFSFVNEVIATGPYEVQPADQSGVKETVSGMSVMTAQDDPVYGASYNQIHMLHGDYLHGLGYRGEGKVIAVLDGGFSLADELPVFDSLWMQDRILGTKDFVVPGGNVFTQSVHGMHVLSVMGGQLPGSLTGTAPRAKYLLLRSENVANEYILEEYNWVSAAEYADSAGADLINSSLGYTRFDDPLQNHSCSDMDGQTTPVTRGANMAARRGILVVNSAGNSGGTDWVCVSAPSDGLDVLGVAAVDENRLHASFSSSGRVSGTFVKPNVSAQGKNTIVASTDGTVRTGNGTSFAAPVITGLAACLWQSLPSLNRIDLKTLIEQYSSQYAAPDSLLGYGLPDFQAAYLASVGMGSEDRLIAVYPNPFEDYIKLEFYSASDRQVTIQVFDFNGRKVYEKAGLSAQPGKQVFTLNDLQTNSKGLFLFRVSSGMKTKAQKAFRLAGR
ncbi:MAG: T9SS type A sorting domain-containing protein [Bacteroidetes bacterium]|nr:T9SS type A sorting domain-containing protein [Bacteroidota bacterium]